MIKSISFIVLTKFFHFNELNFKATRLLFFKLNQQYFFTVSVVIIIVRIVALQV